MRLIVPLAALLAAGCGVRRQDGPPPAPIPGPLYTRPVQERTVPAGRMLWLRTLESIQSDSAAPRRAFHALIVRDVLDPNGNILIPTGSQARLVAIPGEAGALMLGIHSVRVMGNTYMLVPAGGDAAGPGMPLGSLVDGTAGNGKAAPEDGRLIAQGPAIRVPDNSLLIYRLAAAAVLQ